MYRQILVGTDGSETAARAVDRAVDVAASTGAALTILTASTDEKRGLDVARGEAERHAGSGVAIDTAVSPHDPASAIMESCESGAFDLIVLGNKGMTGASRFFALGSVPNKVSHHVHCNLLIVRTS